MTIAVELPALGESVVEGTVSRWLVKEGDGVAADQPLVEVTTDKVDAEIPSPAAGVLEKILVPEMNAGQLVTLLRAEYLVPAEGLNKVTGKPFKIAEIEAALRARLEP